MNVVISLQTKHYPPIAFHPRLVAMLPMSKMKRMLSHCCLLSSIHNTIFELNKTNTFLCNKLPLDSFSSISNMVSERWDSHFLLRFPSIWAPFNSISLRFQLQSSPIHDSMLWVFPFSSSSLFDRFFWSSLQSITFSQLWLLSWSCDPPLIDLSLCSSTLGFLIFNFAFTFGSWFRYASFLCECCQLYIDATVISTSGDG